MNEIFIQVTVGNVSFISTVAQVPLPPAIIIGK